MAEPGEPLDLRSRRSREQSEDRYNSELPPDTGNLAAALPESQGVTIDLSPRPARDDDDEDVVGDEMMLPEPAATHPVIVPTPSMRAVHRQVEETPTERPAVQAPGQPEEPSMLTADRLLQPNRKTRPAPEGRWTHGVYSASFGVINLGDSKRARARKKLDARIQRSFSGGTRFVPVLTRKGGVGKTTVTALLGMALADSREDRVIAIDANPDRGTLSERVANLTKATVRDVVNKAASIGGYTDFSTLVSRDETRLDVLASDTDPMLSEAFSDDDYNVVADLAARFYSLVLTDCGTGIVHSVMRATLRRADSIVIVSGGSVDEARLASETLTWLEANGYGELVANAIVALNTAAQGTNHINLSEIEKHFQSRVRQIVRIPYDPVLAAGSAIHWKDLKPLTRYAARVLAAEVVEGLPA